MRKKLIVVAVALASSACAGTLGPSRFPGASEPVGQVERARDTNRYRIAYSGPPSWRVGAIERLALHRAAELTLSNGFSEFVLVDRGVARDVYVLRRGDDLITYRGGFGQWRRYWRAYCIGHGLGGCRDDPLWPSARQPKKETEVALTIEMVPGRGSRWFAIDAATLLRLLDQEVSRLPPSPDRPGEGQ